jgi:hypothetical protein
MKHDILLYSLLLSLKGLLPFQIPAKKMKPLQITTINYCMSKNIFEGVTYPEYASGQFRCLSQPRFGENNFKMKYSYSPTTDTSIDMVRRLFIDPALSTLILLNNILSWKCKPR